MKNMILVGLIAIVSILVLMKCERQNSDKRIENNIISAKKDTIKHFIDNAGRTHAIKSVAEGSIKDLELAYTTTIDSLKNILKLKDEQFNALVLASTTTSGVAQLRVDTVYVDSARSSYNVSYADKWLSLFGSIGEKNFINYEIKDSLAFTVYQKNTGFLGLGKPLTYIDGFSFNPKSIVYGLTAMQIPVRQPGRFSIGPYVGYGYDGYRWQPSVGLSVQYSVIRF